MYSPLPFFHSSSLFTGWASALTAGVPIAIRPRFSASGTLPDIRRYGATILTYTGKVLNYILAVPERADDGTTRSGWPSATKPRCGTSRSSPGVSTATFETATGRPRASSSSAAIPSMPDGALGRQATRSRSSTQTPVSSAPPPSRRPGTADELDSAVGEIVETAPTSGFEGYYKNEEATQARFRDGWYWSGDLAYRDGDGWFYFAGRSNEWLRVDGENFAAAPVEAIIARHPGVRSVAVYAVPDDPVGDRVMVALELEASDTSTPSTSTISRRPARSGNQMGARIRPIRRRAAQAGQHEDRQAAPSPGGLADRRVWWRQKRRPIAPMSDSDRQRLEHLSMRLSMNMPHFPVRPNGDLGRLYGVRWNRRPLDRRGVRIRCGLHARVARWAYKPVHWGAPSFLSSRVRRHSRR